MELLSSLLAHDPAAPRITVYEETSGARLDFSATTLNNWACKIANMLVEEFDLTEGDTIGISLPTGWQACTLALSAYALGIGVDFHSGPDCAVVFTAADRIPDTDADIALVTADPLGRGVVECGDTLPEGMVDFGPTVRMYGDDYPYPTRTLEQVAAHLGVAGQPAQRVLATGFHNEDSFARTVIGPLAAGGSVVLVHGMADTDRLDSIAAAEKTTHRL